MMCGLAGIFSFKEPIDETRMKAALARMMGLMARRGPDDAGTWLDPGGCGASSNACSGGRTAGGEEFAQRIE